MTPRRAALLASGAMLLVYLGTLAPSVTFWDAGEFIAAARVLGIPHPPGTPLYVVILNAWARAFPFLPFAVATNLFSAVCTACALGLAAWWLARTTGESWPAVGGAVTAGAMSSVWLNATETEVYAASLCLSVAAIVAADVAGRRREFKWRVLAAYLLALAIPLHLSALVVAPVVVYLAAQPHDDSFDWRAAIALTGVTLFVVGVSKLSIAFAVCGALGVVGAEMLKARSTRRRSLSTAAVTLAVIVVAVSAVAILLVRAWHDPPINQANPTTIRDLAYAVGRRQYSVAGVWPRQAPLWLQLANWFEYADWQVALALAPTVIPTVSRVVMTLAFAGLAFYGASWHRRADRRTWRAVFLLFLCGSVGVIAYVNLKAGTSFAWQLVPDAKDHEARDRDYFFVLGFLAWGLWAGMGAVALATRFRLPKPVGLALAGLPILLNWSSVTRRAEPEAGMARELARSLLDPLPPNAVLFVAGDNDTYPLWFAQHVEGRRRDVTIVTIPLLAAAWYVAEIERRDGLAVDGSGETIAIAERIAQAARAARRPVAVALTVSKAERNRLGARWMASGLVALERNQGDALTSDLDSSWSIIPIARGATERARETIEAWRKESNARPATDPVHEYFLNVLSCPRLALERRPSVPHLALLDSLCNLR